MTVGRIPLRRVALVVAVICLGWLAVGAWQLLDAVADLRSARDGVGQLQSLEPDADLQKAQADLSEARGQLQRAARRLQGVAVAPYRLLPRIGDSIEVAADLSAAGGFAAQAGETVVAAVNAFPDGLNSLAPAQGALPVDRISELAVPLQQADGLLRRSLDHLRRAQGRPAVAQLDDARTTLSETLPQISDRAQRAAALSSQLPEFLGANGARRYLFVAQNPAETRGTGGFIGAFSVATMDQGRLKFSSFNQIQSLPAYHSSQVVAPSAEYARRYNEHGGAGFWHNINMTPDFPTAARAMLTLYEKGTGERLDGVIATDPFALEALIAVSGPVDVPGFGTVEADEVVDVVSHEAHAKIDDSQRRKRLLGDVSVGAFTNLLQGDGDSLEAFTALAGAAGEGHIQLRASRPEVQAALLRGGVAGAMPDPEGDFLAVVGNAGSAAKLDYYVRRSVAYEVALNEDGSAASTMTLTLQNKAPSSGISHRVIGPNAPGLEAGEQRLILSTYAADGAELGMVSAGGAEVIEDTELGHKVFTVVTTVAAKSNKKLFLNWERAAGWRPDGDRGVYQLTVHPQTTLRETPLRVVVTPPDGWRVAGVSGGEVDAGRAVVTTILDQPVAVLVQLERTR